MRGRRPRCRWVATGCCALLAVAALACAIAWQRLFDSVLASQIALIPSSAAFPQWLAPTVPLFFDVYLFNWTNADNFPQEKPHVEQLGPYRYIEYRRHVNVTWHPGNATIAYRTQRTWYFDAAGSNGSLDDNVTMLNVISASAVYRSRDWSFFRQKGLGLGLAMFSQKISVSKTARELLFDGYEDPLLDLAKSLPESATGGAPPVDRFGLFYSRNNSMDTDGYVEVTTGTRSGTLPGQMVRWNHLDHLPYYSGECSKLAGTAGEFFPRDLTEESDLVVFVGDLCRTLNLQYAGSGLIDGLSYHKYEVGETTFDISPDSDGSSCYCGGACGWTGVMNVSACRYGSPIFISLPHFLGGDPRLHDQLTGLAPDPDKHSFYFAIEPKLGVPLDVAARFQMNVYLEPSPNIALYEDVPRMLFPIMWVEQKVMLSSSLTAEMRYVRAVADWGAVCCAGVALAIAAALAFFTCCTKREYSPKDLVDKKDEAEMKLNPM